MLDPVVVPVLVTVKLIVPAASLIARSFTENDGRSSSFTGVGSGVPSSLKMSPVPSSLMVPMPLSTPVVSLATPPVLVATKLKVSEIS